MKKLYSALLALLLFTCIPAIAQKGLYFGLAGTIQSTWITNQNNYNLPAMDYKSAFGGAGNINVGFDFTNHLGVKLEVGYGKFAQKYSDKRGDSVFSREVKMNHLMIPILLKYRTGGAIAKFYVAIGPQFDMLLSASQNYLMNGANYDTTLETVSGEKFGAGKEEIKERFSSMDVFARMDLGLDVTIVKHLMIEFGIKFGYGLMDINSTDYRIKDTSGNYHPSHNVFGGLTLGLNYRL
jgi:Outer membrane protein beta-barrel domain